MRGQYIDPEAGKVDRVLPGRFDRLDLGLHRSAAQRDRPLLRGRAQPRAAIRRSCPVVGSWPGKDVTTRAAGILETELTAGRVPHDLKVYAGAKHSFFNDQWRTYHADAAADSWRRVLGFFDQHVRRATGAP